MADTTVVRIHELPDISSGVSDGNYIAVDAQSSGDMTITTKATAAQVKDYVLDNTTNFSSRDVKFKTIDINEKATVPTADDNSNDTTVANTKWVKKLVNDITSGMTKERVVTTDSSKKLVTSNITTTELNSLSGVTGNIQEQLNLKSTANNPVFTGDITTKIKANYSIVTNDSGVLTAGGASSTEVSYLSGVSGNIQTQLDTKATHKNPSFTGYIKTPLVGGYAVVTDTEQKLTVSKTTKTELDYLKGTTSNVQTQLDNKLALKPTTINFSSATGTPTISADTKGIIKISSCVLDASSSIVSTPDTSSNDNTIATTDFVKNKILAMKDPFARRMYKCIELLGTNYSNRFFPNPYGTVKNICSKDFEIDRDSEVYVQYGGETTSAHDGADLIAKFPGEEAWRVLASTADCVSMSDWNSIYLNPLVYSGQLPKGTKIRIQAAGSHPYYNSVYDHYISGDVVLYFRLFAFEFTNKHPQLYSPFEYDYDVTRNVYKEPVGKERFIGDGAGNTATSFGRACGDGLYETGIVCTGGNYYVILCRNAVPQCTMNSFDENRFYLHSFTSNMCAGDYIHFAKDSRVWNSTTADFSEKIVSTNNGTMFMSKYCGELTETNTEPTYSLVKSYRSWGPYESSFDSPGTGVYKICFGCYCNGANLLRQVYIQRGELKLPVGFISEVGYGHQTQDFYVKLQSGDIVKVGGQRLAFGETEWKNDTRTDQYLFCDFYKCEYDTADTIDKKTVTWDNWDVELYKTSSSVTLQNALTYAFKNNGVYDVYIWNITSFNGVIPAFIRRPDATEWFIGYVCATGNEYVSKFRVKVNKGEVFHLDGTKCYTSTSYDESLENYNTSQTIDHYIIVKKIS